MHCGSCDHVWQRPDAPTDAFSLIVGSASAGAMPAPGRRPSGGPQRALRFEVQLPIRFRAVGASGWERGTTVNISQSGMLCRCERPVPARTDVEVLVELTASRGATDPVTLIRCVGQTARSVPPVRPGAYAAMGITVREYRAD